jgi:hypothetical protein
MESSFLPPGESHVYATGASRLAYGAEAIAVDSLLFFVRRLA